MARAGRLATTLLLTVLALAACSEQMTQARDAETTKASSGATKPGVPTLTGRVVDTARILPADQEALMTGRLAALERRTSHQFVVATVPSLDGFTIEAYSLALANSWQIGRKGIDDGVMLVVAPNDRKLRIELGNGIMTVLTPAESERIIARAVAQFEQGHLPAGVSGAAAEIEAALDGKPTAQ